MLSPRYREILCQTATSALSLANCQILMNSVRPGSWNAIVPIHGVSYAAAMALLIDAADGQGWLRDLVQRLVNDYPGRPEFAEVLAEIDRGGADPLARFVRPRWRTRPRLLITGGLLTIALTVGTGMYVGKSHILNRDSEMLAPRTVRPSIAVLGFKNQSGTADDGRLAITLAELFNQELSASEALRVVSSENVARMKFDLQLADTDSLAPDSLQRIRSNLGVDMVLIGTYLTVLQKVRISVQLQDTASGETVESVIDSDTRGNLIELTSRAGRDLRAKIGAGRNAVAPSTIAAALPAKQEAVPDYLKALERLRAFDACGARDLLLGVVERDPNHALAHSALAAAWSSLGYREKARDEAKTAFEKSRNLPSEQQHIIEGRYLEAAGEWAKAVDVYRKLWNSHADNVDYGLDLARVSVAGGFANDAYGVADNLRKLPPPQRDDPRIDLAESSAAHALGDFKRARIAAQRASAKASKIGARLLLARARLQQAQANLDVGENQQATTAADEAREIFAAAQDHGGESDAQINLAVAAYSRQDFIGALQLYEQSLAIKQQIGDDAGVARLWSNMAAIDFDQGRLDVAKQRFERSRDLYRKIGNEHGVGEALNNLAAIDVARAELASANDKYRQSLEIAYKTQDKSARAMAQHNQAALLEAAGNLRDAFGWHNAALQTQRDIGERIAEADSLISIARILQQQDDVETAKNKLSESLTISRKARSMDLVFQALLAVADLDVKNRRGAPPQSLARVSLEHFQNVGAADREAAARVTLARTLVDAGKLSDAAREIELAERYAVQSQDPFIRISIDLLTARIRAASGRPADLSTARKALQSDLDLATKHELVAEQLGIQLALGEVELKLNRAAGQARLDQLERDATAKGFLLIARKAKELQT